ncbi:MAG: tetratricopeptide repeat-containing sensor histidine kinase [Bacteroidota bacterium]|nr:tetratricopeptide repeat-containing sensor histidine kinase [Bacteroidota bacterium]
MTGLHIETLADSADQLKKEVSLTSGKQKLKALDKLNKELIHIGSQEVYPYALQQLSLARSTGDSSQVAHAIFNIGEYYYNCNKYKQARDFYLRAADLFRNQNDRLRLAGALNNVSLIYQAWGEYPSALKYAQRSLSISENLHSWDDIADAKNNIASILLNTNNFSEALHYLREALQICKDHHDLARLGITYNSIGAIYSMMNRTDISLKYFTKAHDIYKKLGDDFRTAFTANNIGTAYLRRNNPKFALSYEKEAYMLFCKADYPRGISNALVDLSDINYRNKNYTEGDRLVREGLRITRNNELKNIRLACLDLYRKSLKDRGDIKQAYTVFAMYVALKDSIFNEEKSNQLSEIQTKYQTTEKEKQITGLLKENKIHLLEVKQRNLQLGILALLSIFFIILMVFFYYQYHVKQRLNKLLEEKNERIVSQNEQMHLLNEEYKQLNADLQVSEQKLMESNSTKDKFFSIIAHDLKNPFHSILGFSNMMEYRVDQLSKDEIKDYSHSIYSSSSRVYRLLDNLLNWARSQSGKLLYQPIETDLGILTETAVAVLDPVARQKKIKIENLVSNGITAISDANMFETVLRNLINNAVKFTNPGGWVRVFFSEEKDRLVFCVQDNGVGIRKDIIPKLFDITSKHKTYGTQDEEGSGLGLLVCSEFVNKMGGRMWVESEEGQGSCFFFSIPK